MTPFPGAMVAREDRGKAFSPSAELAVCLDASKLNHSCRHNAHHSWNANLGRLTAHAVRNIVAGEEITINRLDPASVVKDRAGRQKYLQEKEHIPERRCELCSLPEPERLRSDARRAKIETLYAEVGSWERLPELPVGKLLRAGRQVLELAREEEGLYDAVLEYVAENAYGTVAEHRNEARGFLFAKILHEARLVKYGDDHPETMRCKLSLARFNTEKVPRGLSEDELDGWLWMRPGTEGCDGDEVLPRNFDTFTPDRWNTFVENVLLDQWYGPGNWSRAN